MFDVSQEADGVRQVAQHVVVEFDEAEMREADHLDRNAADLVVREV